MRTELARALAARGRLPRVPRQGGVQVPAWRDPGRAHGKHLRPIYEVTERGAVARRKSYFSSLAFKLLSLP